MVKRGPWLRSQASEGEAQHGPFCWTGRIGQEDQNAEDFVDRLLAGWGRSCGLGKCHGPDKSRGRSEIARQTYHAAAASEPAGATEHRPQKAGETADVRSNNAHHTSAFQPRTPADVALTEMFRGTPARATERPAEDGRPPPAGTTPTMHRHSFDLAPPHRAASARVRVYGRVLLRSAVILGGCLGPILIVVENKQTNSRGQIRVPAFSVDLPHQLRERRILSVGNGPQSTPESILKTDASFVTGNDYGTLDDARTASAVF
jgi:hypothetical protein